MFDFKPSSSRHLLLSPSKFFSLNLLTERSRSWGGEGGSKWCPTQLNMVVLVGGGGGR